MQGGARADLAVGGGRGKRMKLAHTLDTELRDFASGPGVAAGGEDGGGGKGQTQDDSRFE